MMDRTGIQGPLYKSLTEFKYQIYKSDTPHLLNAIIDALRKGDHRLSDDDQKRVWGMLRHRGQQLGFSRYNSDNKFYEPLKDV